jgi:hypothetical protein
MSEEDPPIDVDAELPAARAYLLRRRITLAVLLAIPLALGGAWGARAIARDLGERACRERLATDKVNSVRQSFDGVIALAGAPPEAMGRPVDLVDDHDAVFIGADRRTATILVDRCGWRNR